MSIILILAKLSNGTGNKTTAERIRCYLHDEGKKDVRLCNVSDFQNKFDFQKYVIDTGVKAVIGIHALRAGKLIEGLVLPYVIIFGGTDVHCDTWSGKDMEIMRNVVEKANYHVAFSNVMKTNGLGKWPFLKEHNIILQPQGVITDPCCYSYNELFQDFQKEVQKDFETKKIFLFVGGIRRVKDPLYLVNVMSDWNKEDDSVIYVIIGPELDVEFHLLCKEKIDSLQGVYMFPSITFGKIHALLQQSVALVNTSSNEGMAGAILEAMHLRTPVIARYNTGNASVIKDGENGMLFGNHEEFKSKAMKLLKYPTLREELGQNGQDYVKKNHNSKDEETMYKHILNSLLNEKLSDHKNT